MSFTDQKPRIATAEECTLSWGGAPNGERFRCMLCGHRFQPGDQWRWVYSGDTVNVTVCEKCDGENADVIARWKAHVAEARQRFWWFLKG